MSVQSRVAGMSSKSVRQVVLGVAIALGLVVVAGGVVWTVNCPCETTPGFVLLGDAHEEPVDDWSFANDISLCAIQIGIWGRPHSVNVNCMATPEGDLFISCSVGDQKYWCPRVAEDHPGRLRLDGVVYPRRPQPRDGPGHARSRLVLTHPQAAEAGGAGAAAGGRRRAASARHAGGPRAGGRSASSREGSARAVRRAVPAAARRGATSPPSQRRLRRRRGPAPGHRQGRRERRNGEVVDYANAETARSSIGVQPKCATRWVASVPRPLTGSRRDVSLTTAQNDVEPNRLA